jgi:hypothetical protein
MRFIVQWEIAALRLLRHAAQARAIGTDISTLVATDVTNHKSLGGAYSTTAARVRSRRPAA